MQPAIPTRLSLDSGEFLAMLPTDLALELGAAMDGAPFRVIMRWVGGTSTSWLFEVSGARRYIVFKYGTPEAPMDYEAAVLSAATQEGPRLPALYAVMGGGRALLMEYIRGLGVRRAVRRGAEVGPLAVDVARALRSYHAVNGVAFGDFHPGNVIASPSGIALMDPAPPDWHGDPPGQEPWVTDVGLWWYSTAARLPWDISRSPVRAWRLLEFGARLAAELERDRPGGLAHAHHVANRHVNSLLHGWPRDKVMYGPVWLTVNWIRWRAGRLASRRS